MSLARCPDCDTLQEITVTPDPVGRTGTARWWRVVLHKKPNATEICNGSGSKV